MKGWKNIGLPLILAVVATFAASVAAAAPYAILTGPGGTVFVDVETRRVVQDLGRSGLAIAALPGAPRAYLATGTSIAAIDPAARAVISELEMPGARALALNRNGDRVFVVTGGAVKVVSTENHQVLHSIPQPSGSQRIVLSPLGTQLFVSNTEASSVSVIDPVTYNVTATIPTSDGPLGLAVDPTGRRLLVTHNSITRTVRDSGNTISIIDIESRTVLKSIVLDGSPTPDSIVINPSGTRAFVTTRHGYYVAVVDLDSLAVTSTIPVPWPIGIDITPDGESLYVVSYLGEVVLIHPELGTIQGRIPIPAVIGGVGRFFTGPSQSAPLIPGVLSGLWWNPSEPGWGLHLTQRRNTVLAAWFTYDATGAPKWYVSSNCSMSGPLPCPDCVENAFCSGDLYESLGGSRFFRDRFDPSLVRIRNVGVVQMEFRNKDNAKLSYVVGNRTRTLNISRQPIQPSGTPLAADYTDLWWNTTESGWGLGIAQQFGTMFLTWFVYDDTTKPIWYVASGCTVNAAGNGCRGTLYRTSGPIGPIASDTFSSSAVRVTTVGSIDVTFSDSNNGILTYTVDGVTGSKAITRQIF